MGWCEIAVQVVVVRAVAPVLVVRAVVVRAVVAIAMHPALVVHDALPVE